MINSCRIGRKCLISFIIIISAVAPCFGAVPKPKVIHCFVALCDNRYQGIVPVPEKLGNGDDPGNNLYWGAAYGVKTFFKKSSKWKLISTTHPDSTVLERCLFQYGDGSAYLVADAYRGKNIRTAISDFLNAAAGCSEGKVSIRAGKSTSELEAYGASDLVVYAGHDGLMDFGFSAYSKCSNGPEKKDSVILACMSSVYFKEGIRKGESTPLLWTTGLMAPEAYTLEAALRGWLVGEKPNQIRLRAAKAYSRYQKIPLKNATRLFVTGYKP